MFCDLVGSTALSAQFDPEDMRKVIGAYYTCIAEVIGRYQGYIARYMGDGVLAYFGYPQAHEDDAEQAVRAGLVLVEAVAHLHGESTLRCSFRIGIATGTVVVGDMIGDGTAQEQSVVGETPNLAARLQTLAEPGTVVICGEYPPADRGTLRLPRSRSCRAQGLGGADPGLAGPGDERRGEPLRCAA